MNESGTAPHPSPLVPARPKSFQQDPVAYVSLRVALCCLLSFLMPHGRKRKRNGTERRNGGTKQERNGNDTRHTRTKRKRNGSTTAESRTKTGRPARNPTRKEAGKGRGKCAALSPFTLYRDCPFSFPFPFTYARKKNYFSTFTLCFATFQKKVKKNL